MTVSSSNYFSILPRSRKSKSKSGSKQAYGRTDYIQRINFVFLPPTLLIQCRVLDKLDRAYRFERNL
jgi:hypothetical protein